MQNICPVAAGIFVEHCNSQVPDVRGSRERDLFFPRPLDSNVGPQNVEQGARGFDGEWEESRRLLSEDTTVEVQSGLPLRVMIESGENTSRRAS